jgi:hypothetical protein
MILRKINKEMILFYYCVYDRRGNNLVGRSRAEAAQNSHYLLPYVKK